MTKQLKSGLFMRAIINYFTELLQTLKSIDESLKMISACVNKNMYQKTYIKTGHWNE